MRVDTRCMRLQPPRTFLHRCVCVPVGYNAMGYEMSKPNLRAELEADLKLVSEGRKDKRSVLQHHILKYRAVFVESVRKAKKLVGLSESGSGVPLCCETCRVLAG